MRLEEGKTLLQTVASGDATYNLYYGNKLYEIKNGIEDRSVAASVPEETYQELLSMFKQSEEYKQYDEYQAEHGTANISAQPSQVQTQAQSQNTAELDVLNKQIASLQQQMQSLNATNSNLQQQLNQANSAVASEKQKTANVEAEMKRLQESMEAKKEEMGDDEDDEDDDDEYETSGASANKFQIIGVVLMTMTLLVSGFSFVKLNKKLMTLTEQSSEPANTDTLTLTIDGEQYEINASQIELKDGESSISVYGLMTTNENGEKTKQVIPLGEIKVENTADSTDSTEATAPAETESGDNGGNE